MLVGQEKYQSGATLVSIRESQQNLIWVIPERALHGDKIYLMGDDNRLQVVTVEVLYRRNNQVVIDGELEQGQKLIINDLLPAINGMLLKESPEQSQAAIKDSDS